MKVVTIGNMYPPQQLGGAEIVWHSWVQHARDAGHEVQVLTTDVALRGVTPPPVEDGIRRTLRWYWRDHAFPRLRPYERWAIERHNARELQRILDEVRPDVVVWWAMAGMSFALVERVRRHGLPSVAVLGDYWLNCGPDVDGWMKVFRDRPRLGAVVERVTGLPATVRVGSASPAATSAASAPGCTVTSAFAATSQRGGVAPSASMRAPRLTAAP